MSGTRGYLVGVDVGGTTVKTALLAPTMAVLDERRVATPRERGSQAVVDAMVAATADVLARGRRRYGCEPDAVGVGCLGVVDEVRGVAVESAAVGWSDVPVTDLLSRLTSAPVALGHDVRAGALAEAQLGAGRGVKDFVFVTLGTGVGGAVVLDGRPRVGRGRVGELGHVVVDQDGAPCGCGGRGCLETIASGPAISRRYLELTGRALSVPQLLAEARGGDAAAGTVWQQAVQALATVLATTTMLLDPQAVVVGGGVALAGDALLDPLRRELDGRVRLGPAPVVRLAALGDRAGIIGAALMAAQRQGAQVPA